MNPGIFSMPNAKSCVLSSCVYSSPVLSPLPAVVGMQPPLPPEAVRELVCSCLHRDPVAADLRCSLFVAAAQNYKRDSLLRPFPPRYIAGDNKDFEELVRNNDDKKAPINEIYGLSNARGRVNGKTRHVIDSRVYSDRGSLIQTSLFSSLVGRCEVFAWCKRAGETAAQRRRSSSGSHALDPLLKEFCCEDTTKRRSTSEHTNTPTTLSGTILPSVYHVCFISPPVHKSL